MRSARASASFCRWASDSRAPPTPVGACRPDLDDPLAQAEIVQDLADQLADPLGRLGLAVGDLAEQDVVLKAGAGGVVLGVEERDRAGEIGGQLLAEQTARLEDARLQRLVDQAEPMARRDQLEGQRDQALAVALAQRVELGSRRRGRSARGSPADRRRR